MTAVTQERPRRAHRLKPGRHQIFRWECWRTVIAVEPCSWDTARVEIRTVGTPSFTMPANATVRSRLTPAAEGSTDSTNPNPENRS